MSPRLPTPPPERLADPARDDVGMLVRVARDLEPGEAAQERIWHAIETRFQQTKTPLLDAARLAVEPPPGALERIWRRLIEEARAKAGLGQPSRLVESEPGTLGTLLGAAAELEPGYAVDVRVRRRVESASKHAPRPFAWVKWVLGPVAVATATAWFIVTQAPMPLPAPTPVAVAVAPAAPDLVVPPLAAPTRLATGTIAAGGPHQRTSLAGVGDLVVAGRSPRLDVVRDDDSGTRLRLVSGRVVIHAEKRDAARPLSVEAGGVEVVVVGTVFAVETAGTRVQVLVSEGTVAVRRAGLAPLFVRAGERWSSTGEMPPATWMAREATLVTAGASIPLKTTFAPVNRAPPARPLDGPGERVAVVDAEPFLPPPVVATVVPPPSTPVKPPALDLRALAAPFAGADLDTLQQALVAARRAQDVKREAGALWRFVEHPDATARLRLESLEALATLVDGPLAAPAVAVQLRRDIARRSRTGRASALYELSFSLHELGRTEEALAVVAECLADCEPSRLRVIRVLRARLLQDAGRLDAARAAFREVHALEPDDAVASAESAAAEVLALRARFHAERGQLDRARRAAQSSLALDPAGVHARDARALLTP